MKHIHDSGYLHNDMKEDNVVISKNDKREWVPVIIDFSESCLITECKKRKYKSFHRHIEPAVLRGDKPHSVYSDLYGFLVITKTVLETVNTNDPKLNIINKWLHHNFNFKFADVKKLFLETES